MTLAIVFSLSLLVLLCLLILAGVPVFFSLTTSALVIAFTAAWFDSFSLAFLSAMPGRIYGSILANELLLAIPFFVGMGAILERTHLARDLLNSTEALLRRTGGHGGRLQSVTLIGTLLGAATGLVGASITTLATLTVPTLKREGYQAAHIAGAVAASGTLGQIIPPSILLVLLTEPLAAAWSEAAQRSGSWAPEPVTSAHLFAGALVPGLMLSLAYIVWQGLSHKNVQTDRTQVLIPEIGDHSNFLRLLLPLLLIISVPTTIILGIATPTEAASVGFVAAWLLAGADHRLPIGSTGKGGQKDQTGQVPEPPRRYPRLPAAEALIAMALVGAALTGAVATAFLAELQGFGAFPAISKWWGSGEEPLRRAHIIGSSLLLGGLGFALLATLMFNLTKGKGWVATCVDRFAANRWFCLAGVLALPLLVATSFLDGSKGWARFAIALLAFGLVQATLRFWRANVVLAIFGRIRDMTAMIAAILIGASLFSLVFRGVGGAGVIEERLTHIPGGSTGALLLVLGLLFLLGFLMEFIELIYIIIPIAGPFLLTFQDLDPVLLGVLVALVLQTSFLTPPFGIGLFYLKGAAGDHLPMRAILVGIWPYISIQLLVLALVLFFPILALALPHVLLQ